MKNKLLLFVLTFIGVSSAQAGMQDIKCFLATAQKVYDEPRIVVLNKKSETSLQADFSAEISIGNQRIEASAVAIKSSDSSLTPALVDLELSVKDSSGKETLRLRSNAQIVTDSPISALLSAEVPGNLLKVGCYL
ncbi:hypothetical protein [Bdellovibrio sp.]|uniref:hypothetical protein n=1 Tax=Bdellovibrio sp. TaxID=28201 RepID=UPI0039E5BDB3